MYKSSFLINFNNPQILNLKVVPITQETYVDIEIMSLYHNFFVHLAHILFFINLGKSGQTFLSIELNIHACAHMHLKFFFCHKAFLIIHTLPSKSSGTTCFDAFLFCALFLNK